ncbi:MAG TPA: ZIP family metal transporter [Verrucomicrobiota bacterium]|nr:ZIP family metal transporter [Verrucomicrobiota bacterium]HQB17572.1 ZIP family metal transporter [Verrucomicrobiota bacterium]
MSTLFAFPKLTLAVYCLAAFLAAVGGGWLPLLVRLTHTRLQLAVSFVAGLMLGLAFLGLLPHAALELGSVEKSAAWLMAGFLAMFILQRFLPFHHHDVEEGQPVAVCGHAHAPGEMHGHVSTTPLGWASVALGLSLHSIFDGLALAAAVMAVAGGYSTALGLGTALAVILHKPFSALAITTLMAAGHAKRQWVMLVNVGFGLVTPVGALLFFMGGERLAHMHPAWLGLALAFCAGTFLCIACADLLPELHFHSHDRVLLSLALLLGLGAAIAINHFGHVDPAHEPAGPGAVHARPHAHPH